MDKVCELIEEDQDLYLILPFLKEDKCDTIVLRLSAQGKDIGSIHSIAPFLSNHAINQMVYKKITKETK